MAAVGSKQKGKFEAPSRKDYVSSTLVLALKSKQERATLMEGPPWPCLKKKGGLLLYQGVQEVSQRKEEEVMPLYITLAPSSWLNSFDSNHFRFI